MKLVFAFLLFSLFAHSYVYTRTASGEKLKWNSQNGQIRLVMSSSNSQGLNTFSVENIFENSILEWQNLNAINVTGVFVSANQLDDFTNRMYFSNNPSFFGDGVLAVTAINYDEISGSISSADIIINDTGFFGSFSLDPSVSTNGFPYLGDVITHEMGHFLGLNHSEVIGSTMMYNVFKGQYSIESDDEYGVKNLYNNFSTYPDSISGNVVGENGVAVFGAHVQLMSEGVVIQGQFTDEDGYFNFYVEEDKVYKIHVSPMKSKDNISEYFRNVRSNYCNGRDFQPAFFSTCNKRDLGVAQRISVDSSSAELNENGSIYLGELTVKCQTPVNPEYLRTKFSSDADDYYLSFDYADSGKSHGGFTGYFTSEQVDAGNFSTPDILKLDLTNYQVVSSGTMLKIHVYTTQIGSPFGVNVGYKNENLSSFTVTSPGVDIDGKVDTHQTVLIPLSLTTSENIFDIEVTPFNLSSSTVKNEIFGNFQVLGNENFIYYLDYEIYDPASFTSTADYSVSDNAACLEGDVGTSSRAFRSLVNSSLDTEDTGLGCGTVDFNNDDNGNGPFSLFVGLMFMLMLGFIREKLNDFFV